MSKAIRTLGLSGIEGYEVSVECDVVRAMPSFDVVGLPDTVVREAKERVKVAAKNSGFYFPTEKVIVNLAPADRKKEGSIYDLPILLGVLASSDQLAMPDDNMAFIGELSLSGDVRPTRGVLSMAIAAINCGIKELFVPAENADEATLAGEELKVYPVQHLKEVTDHINGRKKIEQAAVWQYTEDNILLQDFSEVKGQEQAKRALEIAAAGGHNLLMVGPPGSGKSMLAHRIQSILPPMSKDESLEITQIWSVCGMLDNKRPMITTRTFRSPHHTISSRALVGGGAYPRPGEISLAHNGVLFLDELPEFSNDALEALRQPIEDGEVQISRVTGSITFPCKFQLIAAMNPCKCGWYGHPSGRCKCSPQQVNQYLRRISGPMMDRIDLKIYVTSLNYEELQNRQSREKSSDIKKRVDVAREAQQERFKNVKSVSCNSQMGQNELTNYCQLDADCEALMRNAYEQLQLTARSYDRLLRVSRTIADLDSSENIKLEHLAEAISYRTDEFVV